MLVGSLEIMPLSISNHFWLRHPRRSLSCPQNAGTDGFVALAVQNIEERPHGEIAGGQWTEGRPGWPGRRLLTDDSDVLSCLLIVGSCSANTDVNFWP